MRGDNMDEDFPNFDDFCSSFEEQNDNNTSTDNNFSDFSNMFSGIDMSTLIKIKGIMEKMNQKKNDPRSNLLLSLKPYLKPSRQDKVDQYIQIFNMSSLLENINFMGGEKTK